MFEKSLEENPTLPKCPYKVLAVFDFVFNAIVFRNFEKKIK